MVTAEAQQFTIDFEETELRLGLPTAKSAAKPDSEAAKNFNIYGKRGFMETVDLKLNLSSKESIVDMDEKMINGKKGADMAKPHAKAQVVGWPPVRSFRKSMMSVPNKNTNDRDEKESSSTVMRAAYVKVSMDGAPYLRKVDLKLYKSYHDLSEALAKMFSSFTGNCGSEDFKNESRLVDLLTGSDFVPTYKDKDGDWMLVGDVPWEMFVDSCKRLRIMNGSEAIGLAPRAVEKCKNRS